ncbi:MAG: hypothetical protein P4M15_12705 [Alphaproteobacteria bacterium]|nr:hypothetical protein [Alphaproteobacteria bacterium]
MPAALLRPTRRVVAAHHIDLTMAIANDETGDIIAINHNPADMYFLPAIDTPVTVEARRALYHMGVHVESERIENGIVLQREVAIPVRSNGNEIRISFKEGQFSQLRVKDAVQKWSALSQAETAHIEAMIGTSQFIVLSRPTDHQLDCAIEMPTGNAVLAVTSPRFRHGDKKRAFIVPHSSVLPTREIEVTREMATLPRQKALTKPTDDTMFYPVPGKKIILGGKMVLRQQPIGTLQEEFYLDDRKVNHVEGGVIADMVTRGLIPSIPATPTEDVTPYAYRPEPQTQPTMRNWTAAMEQRYAL